MQTVALNTPASAAATGTASHPAASLPIVSDRTSYEAGVALHAAMGLDGALVAADRADRARLAGDERGWSRWRQIERLVLCLSIPRCYATVH